MDASSEREPSVHCGHVLKHERAHLFVSTALLVLATGVLSCVPEPLKLEDLEMAPPEIVVSSTVLSDTSVVILLTRSIGALEANSRSDPKELMAQIAINDAVVTMTSNNVSYGLVRVQNGMYQSQGMPLVTGNEYFLEVVSPSLGRVTSRAVVQQPVGFDTVKAGPPSPVSYEFIRSVAYTISDPPTRNYYVINFQTAKKSIVMENLLRPDTYTRLLTDESFNGQEFSETFNAITSHPYYDSVSVSIANVSKEYFDYVKLRMENDLELVEIFSEPIEYPTNVQGGKGFFELHISDIRMVY